jgi:hypothetical protein
MQGRAKSSYRATPLASVVVRRFIWSLCEPGKDKYDCDERPQHENQGLMCRQDSQAQSGCWTGSGQLAEIGRKHVSLKERESHLR